MSTNKWSEDRAKIASALFRLRNKPPSGCTWKTWREALKIAVKYGKMD